MNRQSLGDWVNAQGGRFEDVWRCHLLLALEPDDVVSLFQQDDAEVRSAGGRTIYQMKRSDRPIDMSVAGNFIRAATSGEADSRWVLATSVTPSRKVSVELAAADARSAGTIANEVWPFDPEAPWARARQRLYQRLREFLPDAVLEELREGEVADCIRRLAELQDSLKSGRPMTGEHVREATWGPLLDRLRLTPGLVSWSELVGAEAAPLSNDLRAAAATWQQDREEFVTDIATRAASVAESWAVDGSPSTVVLISGPSGTGKTWALARVGAAIAGRLPVLCTDTEPAPGVDFDYLTRLSGRSVVLVDGFFEWEWERVAIAIASTTNPVLVVGTSRQVRISSGHSMLRKYLHETRLVELCTDPLLTAGEKARLASVRGGLSGSEREALAQANVRRAIRRLSGGDGSQHDEASSVLTHAALAHQGVFSLVIASASANRLPLSLLVRLSDYAPLPDEVAPFVLRRGEGEDEMWWLEEPLVATRTLEAVTEMQGTAFLDEATLRHLRTLVASAQPEVLSHRTAVRRALASADEPLRTTVMSESDARLADIVAAEDSITLAYGWSALVSSGSLARQAFLSAAAVAQPRSAAEVLLLSELLAHAEVGDQLLALLAADPSWSAERAARAIEAAAAVPDAVGAAVFRRVVDLARHAVPDHAAMLASRNTAQLLTHEVAARGRPAQRVWLSERMRAAIADPSSSPLRKPWALVGGTMALLDRTLMQDRYALTLSVPERAAHAVASGARDLARLRVDLAAAVQALEVSEGRWLTSPSLSEIVTRNAEALEDGLRRGELYRQSLRYIERWDTADGFARASTAAWTFVTQHTQSNLPATHVMGTAVALASSRTFVASVPPGPDVDLLASALAPSPRAVISFALHRAHDAIDSGGEQSNTATDLVKSIALGEWQQAAASLRAFLGALGVRDETQRRAARAFDDEATQIAVTRVALTHAAATVTTREAKDALARAAHERWRDNPPLRTFVLGLLIRLRSPLAEELVQLQGHWEPDHVLERAAVDAILGRDMTVVRQRLVQGAKASHAHWQAAHRAFATASGRAEGDEAEIWELAARLGRPGRLRRE
jgi:hypothetical protein